MSDLFDPLFDLQDAHLKKLDHPFEELQHLIPWEIFRPELDTVYQKERKSNYTGYTPFFLGLPTFLGVTRFFVNVSIFIVNCSLPNARPLLILSRMSFNRSSLR